MKLSSPSSKDGMEHVQRLFLVRMRGTAHDEASHPPCKNISITISSRSMSRSPTWASSLRDVLDITRIWTDEQASAHEIF
jgi:hypothetical protein